LFYAKKLVFRQENVKKGLGGKTKILPNFGVKFSVKKAHHIFIFYRFLLEMSKMS